MKDDKRLTKKQREVLNLLRRYQWKVWVRDREVAYQLSFSDSGTRLGTAGTRKLAARRVCLALQARGLVEYRQDGLGGYSFRLTLACREALR